MYAVAAALPADLCEDGDRLSWALGHQPDPATVCSTWSVPLSADGAEPATHYGYNAQVVDRSFVDLLHGAKAGQIPPLDWALYGLTEPRISELVAAMEFEAAASTERPWGALLARLHLQPIGDIE